MLVILKLVKMRGFFNTFRCLKRPPMSHRFLSGCSPAPTAFQQARLMPKQPFLRLSDVRRRPHRPSGGAQDASTAPRVGSKSLQTLLVRRPEAPETLHAPLMRLAGLCGKYVKMLVFLFLQFWGLKSLYMFTFLLDAL